MQVIKYKIATEINYGTDENPDIHVLLQEKVTSYSNEAKEAALKEAHNGEITIEDDGQPDPEHSREEQLEKEVSELKAALDLLLTGVTE